MELQGKNAIVTGSGKGIGREIALHLAASGASVAVADIDLVAAKAVAQEIQGRGGRALPIHVDVSNSQQVGAMVSETLDTFGSIDILVNNAGIGLNALVVETSDEDLDRVLGVNLKGQFLCSRETAKAMIRQGKGGRIVNISSSAGDNARVEGGAYCASKAGVIQLTKVLSLELGQHGINVNAVSPGLTDTVAGPNVSATKAYREAFLSQVSLGRAAQAGDIAQAVLFLASPQSSYITGEVIHVDGGYAAGKLTVRG